MDMIELRNITEILVEVKEEQSSDNRNLVGLLPALLIVLIVILRMSWTLYKSFGQKTRSPQQRRMYVGSRQRHSVTSQEPTIYVSPSNLPPPPKYECLAPPSYEEVVGIHYPNYQVQPITQPINVALAQSSSYTQPENATNPGSSSSSPNTSTVPTVTTINENAPATTSTEPSAVTVVR